MARALTQLRDVCRPQAAREPEPSHPESSPWTHFCLDRLTDHVESIESKTLETGVHVESIE